MKKQKSIVIEPVERENYLNIWCDVYLVPHIRCIPGIMKIRQNYDKSYTAYYDRRYALNNLLVEIRALAEQEELRPENTFSSLVNALQRDTVQFFNTLKKLFSEFWNE